MNFAIEDILNGYNKLQELADPRVDGLPLMGSVFTPAIILACYTYFVFRGGPNLMKNRKPLQLNSIIVYYNLVQITANAFGVLCALYYLPYSNISCMPVERRANFLGLYQLYSHYLYVVLKIVDLLDTVFFVLKKKYNQITFLHMYHHISMVIASWATCKYYPGGQLYYVGGVNCFIHVLVYLYYFLTSWDPSYKGQTWWKKHLTQAQIIQHCTIFCTVLIPLLNPSCSYSKLVLAAYLPIVALMIILFVNFYIKTYVKTKPECKQS